LEKKIWNTKKIPCIFKGTTREKVIFINLYRKKYKLSNICAVLDISPKTYYKYRNTDYPDYTDYLMTKNIFGINKKCYEYRRITDGLRNEYGVIMNGKRF
jgi:hypothetical protein